MQQEYPFPLTALFRDTDSLAPTTWRKTSIRQTAPTICEHSPQTCGFGVLTSHTEAPEVPETTVSTNLL
jgi:hypothetical protein